MSADQLIVGLSGPRELSADMEPALKEFEYTEVEIQGMTGIEGGLTWLVVAILGSPVVQKLLDMLEKAAVRKKITKVTVSKDGTIILENATPEEAAKIIREINDRSKDSNQQ